MKVYGVYCTDRFSLIPILFLSVKEFGVWSRWFPQNEKDSVENVMQAQLTQHSDQLCRTPIRYEVGFFILNA